MELSHAFEYAWYRWLRDLEFRTAMVGCGVDALQANHDSPALRELAAAEDLASGELQALFRRAAASIGIELPSEGDVNLWLATTANKLEALGVPTARSTYDQTNENLLLVCDRLSKVAARDQQPSAADFAEHLALFFAPVDVGDFQRWLDRLVELANRVQETTLDEVTKAQAAGAADLVCWFSYGAVTEEHVEASRRLLRLE